MKRTRNGKNSVRGVWGLIYADIEITAREILEEYLDPEHGALPIYSHEVIIDAETGEKGNP